MSVLVLVLLLTAPNEARPSGADAIARGARDAIGEDARIAIEPRAVLPSDAEALALAQRVEASVVVEVRWDDVAHRRAHLHMHTTDVSTWLERDIAFASEDDIADRDRTLGLAIGAMVTQSTAIAEAPREGPSTAAERARAAAQSGREPPPATVPRAPATKPPIESNRPFSLSLEGTLSPALGANGLAMGGAFVAGFSPAPAFQAHVEGVVRSTSVSTPGAHALTLGGGAGLTWYAYRVRTLAFGPRVDLLALRDDVRLDAGNGVQHRSRWLSAIDVLAISEWRPRGHLAFCLGLGADVSLGTGRIYIGDQRVATLSPVRMLLLAGVVLRF